MTERTRINDLYLNNLKTELSSQTAKVNDDLSKVLNEIIDELANSTMPKASGEGERLTPSARSRGCIKWCAIRQLSNNYSSISILLLISFYCFIATVKTVTSFPLRMKSLSSSISLMMAYLLYYRIYIILLNIQ